jgi:hypothetical protein
MTHRAKRLSPDGLVRHALPLPALQSVRLTHADRVLYPDLGITKADVALYYARVAAS